MRANPEGANTLSPALTRRAAFQSHDHMANRLAEETSSYLRQHADNPVDWYAWGEEALGAARAEDKPIFLSVGYSSCHWCHVMAHESFEDEATAAIMNEHFINVKVDREERPDLDRIYMSAVTAMTGSGGWPMSVFLTPDGFPFFGGTYFPPTPRFGMPSFSRVLLSVAEAWKNRRQDLLDNAAHLTAALQTVDELTAGHAGPGAPRGTGLDRTTLDSAFRALLERFDWAHGGWGEAPKFPQPMALEFLIRYHLTTSDDSAWRAASAALEAMARGGVYDHLGGGFHRYSVDSAWQVPHFEKMLYDNAQLARVYLHAWQMKRQPFHREVCEEVLDYVLREMTGPRGGFFSTQDADSEGEEGKFYVWAAGKIRAALGGGPDPRPEGTALGDTPESELAGPAPRFLSAYAVTGEGNVPSSPGEHFEGKNILRFEAELAERPSFAAARRALLAARSGRVPPARDEKILTSWNGLMLAAFAEAGVALDRPDYLEAARANADFLLSELRSPAGRLYHTWAGTGPRLNGYLEDHSHLMEGLLALYQATFEERWYHAAAELAGVMLARFRAPGGFFDTSDDHETLIMRTREAQDNAVPSGNAMAATALLKLAGLSADPRYSELALSMLESVRETAALHPLAFGQWLVALDQAASRPRDIAILGDVNAPDTRALLAVCRKGYRPHQVIAVGAEEVSEPAGLSEPAGTSGAAVPLLRGRTLVDGRATAYVCRDSTCRRPVTQPSELEALLDTRPDEQYRMEPLSGGGAI